MSGTTLYKGSEISTIDGSMKRNIAFSEDPKVFSKCLSEGNY